MEIEVPHIALHLLVQWSQILIFTRETLWIHLTGLILDKWKIWEQGRLRINYKTWHSLTKSWSMDTKHIDKEIGGTRVK